MVQRFLQENINRAKTRQLRVKDVHAQNFPHTDFVKTLTAGKE